MWWSRSFAVLALIACASAAVAAEPAQRPNVLFIVSDDLNNDLGCYGHDLVQSPNIDRLASQGLTFQHAYCQYPVCNPSRSSLMTSLYPDQTTVLTNGGDFRKPWPDLTTLPQLFRQHGYFAARVGKIYHYGVPLQIGTNGKDDPASWEERINPRGIDREVHDRIHTLQKGQFGGTLSWLAIESKDEEHTDGIGATEAIKLLETQHPEKTGRPFFLAVGFYRPHTPYVAPQARFDQYPREKIQPVMEKPGDRDDIPVAALADRPKQRELTVDQRKEIIQAYYASVSLMDAQVGRVLEALERLKLDENTIVVFTSDHGYHLGAHGLWQKGDLFEGSARVPLVIADLRRGGTAGKTTRSVTELVDLYPTLAELCELPTPEHVKGTSLVPVLKDPAAEVKPAALTVAWSRAGGLHPEVRGQRIKGYSVRTDRYRYTEWNRGKAGRELYDYQTDPEEFTNLVESPEHQQVLAQMQKLLAEAKARAGGE